MAGVGATAAAGGLIAGARPTAANDPNDVTRNVSNPITARRARWRGRRGPILRVDENRGHRLDTPRAILAIADRSGVGTIRADNPAGGGYGVVGNAVNGADFQAFGSGIYAMQPHQNAVGTFHRVGDIYHENGTFQACSRRARPARSASWPGQTPPAAARAGQHRPRL